MTAVEYIRPLLRENSTFDQRRALLECERDRRATIVSVMLSEDTAPSVFNYYMQLTRRQVELDLRQISDKLLGAVRSSLDSNLALDFRHKELRSDIVERMTLCNDMKLRYGTDDEKIERLDFDAPIDTSACWFRQLDSAQQQTISTIQNLRQHSELIETLTAFLDSTTATAAAAAVTPRVVAQATFFHALDSSRALQTMACARNSEQRLEAHSAVPRKKAESFFTQLAKITAEFNEVAITSSQYISRIRSVWNTGIPECPIPLEKVTNK